MAEPRKVIRDYRYEPEKALAHRDAVIEAETGKGRVFSCMGTNKGAVIPPYYPRKPIPAGDPMSPSGTKVELSELADDVIDAIGSGGGGTLIVEEADGSPSVSPTTQITVPNDTLSAGAPGEAILDFNAFALREVVLGPFTALVTPGTAINIQTGVYGGVGSPAPVTGDANVLLPATGAAFNDDGRIEVHLNGQDLSKGDGTGNGVAEWVSSTQIKLSLKVKNKDEIMVRAPFPTA